MTNNVETRAFKAYFRRFGKNAAIPGQTVDLYEQEGKDYIRLANVNGILAVYRIHDDGTLKFMKAKRFYE